MINNLLNIYKTNFQPNQQNKPYLSKPQVNFLGLSNLNTSKLKPLTKDTISFTGVLEYRNALDNHDVCRALNKNAVYAQQYLRAILESNFADMSYYVKDENDNKRINSPSGIIEVIESRVKTSDSIEEKIASSIEEALDSDSPETIRKKIFLPRNQKDIKKHLRDIVGARIVMRDASMENSGKILERLAQTIEKEGIIVEEVENYVPDKGVKDCPEYFDKKDLDKLLKSINKVRTENGRDEIIIDRKPKKSGYMALHLGIDLTAVGRNDLERGFYSELQIIGRDVAMLKDIEDYCYKLKAGKQIKSGHPAYVPFEKFFLEAYANPSRTPAQQKKIIEAFEKYTKLSYQYQRKRQNSLNSEGVYKYPTLNELGLDNVLPSALDFNVLAQVKEKCDELYYISKHPKKCIDKLQ